MTVTAEEFLEHSGVKGMKWGVRKERPSGGGRAGGERKGLSTKQKVIIGSAVVVGVAITAAILIKTGKLDVTKAKELYGKGKKLVDKARSPQAKAAVAAVGAAKKYVDERSKDSNETHADAHRQARLETIDKNAQYKSPTVVSTPQPRKATDDIPLYTQERDDRVREGARQYWNSSTGKTMAKNLGMDMDEIKRNLDDPNYIWEL